MHLSTENKILIGIVVITIAVLVGGAFFLSQNGPAPAKAEYTIEETLGSGYPSKGNKDAKVKIAEYSDFECPACAATFPIVKELLNEYGDKVYFEYHYFPLRIHRWGQASSEAAIAAAEQNKFWELHDLLFAKQSEWANNNEALTKFKAYAKEVGLDEGKFNEALDKQTYAQRVADSVAQGNKLGVQATPTFFVNGKRYEGGMRKDDWKKVIDELLK